MYQEEKYLIIDNAKQFCTVIRCSRQTLKDYLSYGRARVLNVDGSIDLSKLSEWLTNRGVFHQAQMCKEKNPILRFLIKRDVKSMNQFAREQGLFLSSVEIKALIHEMENGNYSRCWNIVGLEG